jgi:plastocyanin
LTAQNHTPPRGSAAAIDRRTLLKLAGAGGAAGLLTAVPALAAADTAAAARANVKIENFTFEPAELTVAPGTTVTWLNGDDIPHTVVATNKAFRSRALDTEDTFSFTFTSAGEFDYFCSLHPHMTGRILVKAMTG